MGAVEFAANITEMGAAAISMVGDAGALFMQEPYIYLISISLAAGFIMLAGGFLLKRRGGRKGRR